MAKKRAKQARKPKGPTLAEQADRHVLYQRAVQSPEADLGFFVARYKALRGRPPLVLREDFCGTAHLSTTWVASHRRRRAIGIDLDEATLQWAREHNVAALPPAARERLMLLPADVMAKTGDRADITCAMNFSYGVFKTRELLKRYFKRVYERLEDDGVFVTELYGGTEAVVTVTDIREYDDFTYEWEQEKYNPITHETLCHIHFVFPDGSRIDRAFSYDWRLWTIPEVRELLAEVGFASTSVWWEAVEEDEDGDWAGTGDYYATEDEDNQEAWLVYVVAAK